MMYYLTHDLIAHITVFQAIMLLIVLTNIYFSHRARRHSLPDKLPRVSILVPVRDEEVTIEACLCSLMGQTYADFEVLVLDDQSSDSTPVILQQIALEDDRLKVLKGSPAPPGIAGKNWACAQLAGQATGELLFFTDADTVHQTNMLAEIVSSMLGEKADMMTGFPRQVVKTWGERLLVPFFTWSSLNFIPLGLAYQLRTSVLSIAVGQMMVFKREAYQAVGGHTTLGTDILDDIVLARRINQSGLRWRVLSIADLIRCRMYRSNREACEGLTKNLFGAFGCRLLPFLFTIAWLIIMTWVPLVVFALWLAGYAPMVDPPVLISCLVLALLTWVFPLAEIHIPLFLVFLYPIIILAITWVMLRSMVFSLSGKLRWKNRVLEKPGWKWL